MCHVPCAVYHVPCSVCRTVLVPLPRTHLCSDPSCIIAGVRTTLPELLRIARSGDARLPLARVGGGRAGAVPQRAAVRCWEWCDAKRCCATLEWGTCGVVLCTLLDDRCPTCALVMRWLFARRALMCRSFGVLCVVLCVCAAWFASGTCREYWHAPHHRGIRHHGSGVDAGAKVPRHACEAVRSHRCCHVGHACSPCSW